MNAVLNRPRAKASKRPTVAAKAEPTAVTIADIRQWIGTAEEKLEMAYDAAERGEPIDTLLDHINHNVILEPNRIIQRDDLTQSDAGRVYKLLFPVLACLEGALKLADNTVVHSTLKEAFDLLDAAQTALDAVDEAVRTLPAGGPEHDFRRGRDLAIEMLRKCRDEPKGSECHRRDHALGAQRLNIVDDYFVEVLCEQSLLDGFTSVLSDALGATALDSEHFADLSFEGTRAGEPVAEGTDVELDAAARAVEPTARAIRTAPDDEAPDPYSVMHQALEVARAAASNGVTDMHWGLCSLVEAGMRHVERAQDAINAKAFSEDLHNKASCELAGLLGVLRAANTDAVDDSLLYAVETLVVVAKEQIDTDNDTFQRSGK
jgi:hypothetical protein